MDSPVLEKSSQTALTAVVDRGFNLISMDGEMLMNDMIVVLGNGPAADKHNAKVAVGSGAKVAKEIEKLMNKTG